MGSGLVGPGHLRRLPLTVCRARGGQQPVRAHCMVRRARGLPDTVRFLPPSRSSSCFLSTEDPAGFGGSPRGESLSTGAAEMRERRLPPGVDSCEIPLAPEGPGGACGGWSRFQSRSRPSLRGPSPPVIARGADGVEGGRAFAEAGPSGIRLSPSCSRDTNETKLSVCEPRTYLGVD